MSVLDLSTKEKAMQQLNLGDTFMVRTAAAHDVWNKDDSQI